MQELFFAVAWLHYCPYVLPAAKASAGSQFFALPKEIKKDPVKGLELTVTKVLYRLLCIYFGTKTRWYS